jgi:predicted dinucleotide-binding enzyme
MVARSDQASATLSASLPGVLAASAKDAVASADVIILATAFGDSGQALKDLGDVTGKVIVDISNPLSADYMSLTVGLTTSAAEQIAASVPAALVVKAFNTVFAQVLDASAEFGGGRQVSVFVASDSEKAKQTVTVLAQSMGFDVVDAGGLKNARYLEPLGGLNVYFAYGAGLGTSIAPTWLHKA